MYSCNAIWHHLLASSFRSNNNKGVLSDEDKASICDSLLLYKVSDRPLFEAALLTRDKAMPRP
jgi:hypothetical protein